MPCAHVEHFTILNHGINDFEISVMIGTALFPFFLTSELKIFVHVLFVVLDYSVVSSEVRNIIQYAINVCIYIYIFKCVCICA